jgi:AcrR family transcriptional regulator
MNQKFIIRRYIHYYFGGKKEELQQLVIEDGQEKWIPIPEVIEDDDFSGFLDGMWSTLCNKKPIESNPFREGTPEYNKWRAAYAHAARYYSDTAICDDDFRDWAKQTYKKIVESK